MSCGGLGIVEGAREVEVSIPAGWYSRSNLMRVV